MSLLLKPPSQRDQRSKRKCRLVICGNFVESQAVDLYAAGVGTDGLRTALVLAAVREWAAATSDITGAFLLAPWPAHVCFTDASYAPFGRRSFGAAVVTLAGAPIARRASRQSLSTLSVMEAELYAATQGCLLMEAVSAVLEEIVPGSYHKVLAIDNSSAASMCSGGAGSQRTRHLKIRANYIREAIQAGALSVRHTPGEYQLADLATKLQPELRLWRLLTLWGFVGEKLSAMVKVLKVQLMSVVLLLSSMFVPADGKTGWEELCLLLLLTCVAVIGLWEASKAVFRSYRRWVKGSRKSKKLRV